MTARREPLTVLEVLALPGPGQALLFVLGEHDPDMCTLADVADELRRPVHGLAGAIAALTSRQFVRRHFLDNQARPVYALTPSGREAYRVLLDCERRWATRRQAAAA